MSLVLNVEILGEFKKLTQATKGAETSLGKLNKTTSAISKTMIRTLGAIGVGFTLNKVVDGVKGAITAASDLSESINAINVAYGEQSIEIEKIGETAAEGLGLSKTELYGIATQFSSFAKTIAGDGGDAVEVVNNLTTRGADFASVFNLEVNTALSKFQSGLAGSSEPLRAYGIDLSAATVTAYALANGIGDGSGQLTEQEKVLARYGSLMSQTSIVQGDFANTSDGLANQQRILNAEIENAKAEIGEGLLPVMAELFKEIRNNLPAIKDLLTKLTDIIPVVSTLVLKMIEYKEQILTVTVGLAGMRTVFLGVNAVMGVYTAMTTGATVASGGLNAALARLMVVFANPYFLGAALIIGGIALALSNLKTEANAARDAVSELNGEQEKAASSSGYSFARGNQEYSPYAYKTPKTTAPGIAGQSNTTNVNINLNRASLVPADVVKALKQAGVVGLQ